MDEGGERVEGHLLHCPVKEGEGLSFAFVLASSVGSTVNVLTTSATGI
jgi:hypothetical protein